MESPELTPQQKYRMTDKCQAARKRYYENKGKSTSREYYLKNRERILEASKDRYKKTKDISSNFSTVDISQSLMNVQSQVQ